MVSIIDADMVVRADFYQRTLPYLQTERDALVLAPQVCLVTDPKPLSMHSSGPCPRLYPLLHYVRNAPELVYVTPVARRSLPGQLSGQALARAAVEICGEGPPHPHSSLTSFCGSWC